MIIQHNIMSLNAHRQMSGNTGMVSKNLEKLSSGYKINRAGDDAAGLAISEKMRAQITGLTRAQSNAQDGISLVQTAEGALTEVHSMLNRMVDLATQSSNGTMQPDDRQKIQDEMNSLTSEINRISESTNFNGINLLDGSLGGTSVTKTAGGVSAGTKASYSFDATGVTFDNSATDTIDGDDFVIGGVTLADAVVSATTSLADLAAKLTAAAGNTTWDFSANGNNLVMTAKAIGVGTPPTITKSAAAPAGKLGTGATATVIDAGTAAGDVTNGSTVLKFTQQPQAGTAVKIGDKTFEFVTNAADVTAGNVGVVIGTDLDATMTALAAAGQGLNYGATITGATIDAVAGTITIESADDKAVSPTITGAGLTLQIGDTADAFNKVTVSVSDMGTEGLGIDAIDVSLQGVSSEAIATIKSAIETVSINRSAMGALQNRLEHTINNLGVTTENMTAAESRIRDVDMAKEMAAFTKNNVLTQAAQAMLAQANQQPQQVLQLLR